MIIERNSFKFNTKTQELECTDTQAAGTQKVSIFGVRILGNQTMKNGKTFPFNYYQLKSMNKNAFEIDNDKITYWVKRSNIDFVVEIWCDFGWGQTTRLYIEWDRNKWSNWSFSFPA